MRENFYKMQHMFYFTPIDIHKIYPDTPDACWECWSGGANFLHAWWDYQKVKEYW